MSGLFNLIHVKTQLGIRNIPARSTLADALNKRDWRIYHELAMCLISRARELYEKDKLDIELDATIYAIKMHTLLDLRGMIPTFIHISDGKMHDVKILDILPIEANAFYVMDRGYVDF